MILDQASLPFSCVLDKRKSKNSGNVSVLKRVCFCVFCSKGKFNNYVRSIQSLLLQNKLNENQVRDPWFLQTVHALLGHLDFSFASAWNPDGQTFATGNQDKTCRIWDIRNLSKSVSVLRGNLGAIRSIRFTSDGRFMAMAEPADFVHIFDVRNGYNKRQELDFFGEISGMSFSPDTEALFVGVWDRTYGSLLQYSRLRNYSYFDSLLQPCITRVITCFLYACTRICITGVILSQLLVVVVVVIIVVFRSVCGTKGRWNRRKSAKGMKDKTQMQLLFLEI